MQRLSRLDNLLRVEDGRCGERDKRGPYYWRVPVTLVNVAKTSIDTRKSEQILGVSVLPPRTPEDETGLHGLTNEVYDVFRSDNVAFVSRWQDDWPIKVGKSYDGRYSNVAVYRIAHGKTSTVCQLKFIK